MIIASKPFQQMKLGHKNEEEEVPLWSSGLRPWVTTVVQAQSLSGEFLHATSTTTTKKKKNEEEKNYEIILIFSNDI